ncbi:MAG TPA: arsenate reductase ArsC [Gammaproteobacteria bacterium]|nr:arsenate reductase ArsC [Gammaproteobacteria bacterium]
MAGKIYNVLFLCTGNSARSIMAEAILNSIGKGRFHAYSAGSHPAGRVNPLALEQIATLGLPPAVYRSKSWDEFADPKAPRMDFVFTVCDTAAKEACPIWPGQPMTAHWGIPDPVKIIGSEEEKRRGFWLAFTQLTTRIRIFTSLPIDALDDLALKKQLDEIGRTT